MSVHYAVLGLLSGGPRSRPEVTADFNWSVGHFWTASGSDVNRALRRGVETGLMTTGADQPDQTQQPDAELYELTERGRAVLDDWLCSEEEFYPLREPFLMRIFFAGRLAPSSVTRLITDHVDAVSEQLAGLQKIAADIGVQFTRDELPFEDRLRLSTLERGIAYAETELRWALTLQEEVSAHEPLADPTVTTI